MAPKLLKPLVRLLLLLQLLLAGLLEVSAQGATAREVKPEVSLHTKDLQGGLQEGVLSTLRGGERLPSQRGIKERKQRMWTSSLNKFISGE